MKKLEWFPLILMVLLLIPIFWSTNKYSDHTGLAVELVRASYTIGLFFMGQYIVRVRDDEKSIKTSQEVRSYVYSIADFLQKPYNNQIQSIRDLVVQMKVNENQDFSFTQVSAFSVNSLKQITNVELFKAFVTKLKGDEAKRIQYFTDLNVTIEFLDKVIDKSIPDYFNSFMDKHTIFNREYGENAKIISVAIQRFWGEADAQRLTDPVSNGFRKIIQNYLQVSKHKEKPRNPFFVFESLMKPLTTLCDANIEDPRCREIIANLTNCRVAIENYLHHRDFYVDGFEQLIGTMTDQKEKFSQSIVGFKNLDK